jgi:hypothetical protein
MFGLGLILQNVLAGVQTNLVDVFTQSITGLLQNWLSALFGG